MLYTLLLLLLLISRSSPGFFPAIAELGDFPAKDLSENSQAGCESGLLAARVGCRLIAEPDFRPFYDVNAGTETDFPAMLART